MDADSAGIEIKQIEREFGKSRAKVKTDEKLMPETNSLILKRNEQIRRFKMVKKKSNCYYTFTRIVNEKKYEQILETSTIYV